ncbi:MAG: YdcF family protein, partial [Candidatus Omnitrophica bacterium]|nr:YdcF family protein [Candidatus Omnitrophota bacterium]
AYRRVIQELLEESVKIRAPDLENEGATVEITRDDIPNYEISHYNTSTGQIEYLYVRPVTDQQDTFAAYQLEYSPETHIEGSMRVLDYASSIKSIQRTVENDIRAHEETHRLGDGELMAYLLPWARHFRSAARTLVNFLAQRDRLKRADLIAVLGHSLLSVPELAAELYHKGYADTILASGGIGHCAVPLVINVRNSEKYSAKAHILVPALNALSDLDDDELTVERMKEAGIAEADIYEAILIISGVPNENIIKERISTNTAENIRKSKQLLDENGIPHRKVILIQHPALQRRSVATFKRRFGDGVECISYPPSWQDIWNASRAEREELISIAFNEIHRFVEYGPQGKDDLVEVIFPKYAIDVYRQIAASYLESSDEVVRASTVRALGISAFPFTWNMLRETALREESKRVHAAINEAFINIMHVNFMRLEPRIEDDVSVVYRPERLDDMSGMFEDGQAKKIDNSYALVPEEFPKEAQERLRKITEDAISVLPKGMAVYRVKPHTYHVNIAVLQDGWAGLDETNKLTDQERERLAALIRRIARECGPIALQLKGVRFGDDGGIIAVWEDSGKIGYMKKRFFEEGLKITEKIKRARPKPFVHTTLCRVLQDITPDTLQGLKKKATELKDLTSVGLTIDIDNLIIVRETQWMLEDYEVCETIPLSGEETPGTTDTSGAAPVTTLERRGAVTTTESKPTLFVGITDEERRPSLQEKLDKAFTDLDIEVVVIPPNARPSKYMEMRVANREAQGTRALGVIVTLDDITDEEIVDILGQYAIYANFDKFEAVEEIIEAIKLSLPGEDIRLKVREIMEDHSLTHDERIDLFTIIYHVLSPLKEMDDITYGELINRVDNLLQTETPFATVTTSHDLETRPDRIKELIDTIETNGSLKDQKPNNVLIITDQRITKDNLNSYLEALNNAILKYTDNTYSLYDIYDRDNIYTFSRFEEVSKKEGITLTKDNALLAAETLIKKIMEREDPEVIYPGGERAFEEEIDLALIIKGVLQNNKEAIERALELLGRKKDSIDITTLRRRIFDLRYYTRKLHNFNKALKEVKRAL